MPIEIVVQAPSPRKGLLSRISPEELFAKIAADIGSEARWWYRHVLDGNPALTVNIYPGSAGITFAASGATIKAFADTQAQGPGYHQHVVELLERLGKECGLNWQLVHDSTTYWQSRNRTILERSFTEWLEELARQMVGQSGSGTSAVVCLSQDVRYDYPAQTVTQLGPRSEEWISEVSRGAWQYQEFWPWWKHGQGPESWLGRALMLMWADHPWRAPLNELEQALTDDIHFCLTQAHEDSSLSIPWKAWHELLPWVSTSQGGISDRIADQAKLDTSEPIGYRRYPVNYHLGCGWNLTLPGTYIRDETDMAEDSICGPEAEIFARVYRNVAENFSEKLARGQSIDQIDAPFGPVCLTQDPVEKTRVIATSFSAGTGVLMAINLKGGRTIKDAKKLMQGLGHHQQQEPSVTKVLI